MGFANKESIAIHSHVPEFSANFPLSFNSLQFEAFVTMEEKTRNMRSAKNTTTKNKNIQKNITASNKIYFVDALPSPFWGKYRQIN